MFVIGEFYVAILCTASPRTKSSPRGFRLSPRTGARIPNENDRIEQFRVGFINTNVLGYYCLHIMFFLFIFST